MKHIIVNGRPLCQLPLRYAHPSDKVHVFCEPIEDAETGAAILREMHPADRIEVVAGPCPERDSYMKT